MSQEQPGGTASSDPEKRAFTGGPDMPPQEPDQPAEGNDELLREDDEQKGGAAPNQNGNKEGNPHGDYTSLPGYGG